MQHQEHREESATPTVGSNWRTEKRIKPHTDPTKAALMFTNPVPTPSITPPHAHTQKLSIVTGYLFFSPSHIFCLQNPPHLPFLSFSFHIPSFTCICEPMPDLLPQCHCLIYLVNPLYRPVCRSSLVSAPSQLWAPYSCRLARGGNMDEENSSSSLCCLHGEAADLAVPPPLSAWLWHAKI